LVRRAIELARAARDAGNGPYGALLVDRAGEVVAEAGNTVRSAGLVSRHAEINVIEAAQRKLGQEGLSALTLVTSAEPCAMCAGAIHWAGIEAVVFSVSIGRMRRDVPGGERQIPLSCEEILALGGSGTQVIGPVLEEEGVRVFLEPASD
jgi:tRNA(Arg) A34 adenosine deaminase TadA